MSPVVDTLLNLSLFVFIGLVIWLYFRDTAGTPSARYVAEQRTRGAQSPSDPTEP